MTSVLHLYTLIIAGAALSSLAVARPSLRQLTRRPVRDRVIQFRFDEPLNERVKLFEKVIVDNGWEPITRSDLTRAALESYLPPLVELIKKRVSDIAALREKVVAPREQVVKFGPNTRVRLPSDLVDQLDAVEAYARGIGHRLVTRSALVRAAIESFLDGAEAELEEHALRGQTESPRGDRVAH